jgi:hypothetical protein
MNIVLPRIKTTNNQSLKVYPSSSEFILKFDGCSKGNPGSAGIGAVIYKNGIEYWASCKYLGDKKTNNEAEYSALILGLENAIEQKITNGEFQKIIWKHVGYILYPSFLNLSI